MEKENWAETLNRERLKGFPIDSGEVYNAQIKSQWSLESELIKRIFFKESGVCAEVMESNMKLGNEHTEILCVFMCTDLQDAVEM